MKVLIVLPTHSAYKDVCDDFLTLFENNWKDCPYDIAISLVGEQCSFGKYHVEYQGASCSLPEAVFRIARKYKPDLVLSFLGDAFIYEKIVQREVEHVIDTIIKNRIEYCCLAPRYNTHKKQCIDETIRCINKKERYAHSFICFAATYSFIENEFASGLTDLDFEKKYLQTVNAKESYYCNRGVLIKNIFHIIPGIEKGKWDRVSKHIIQKHNRGIMLNERDCISIKEQMILELRKVVVRFLPDSSRVWIKEVLKKINIREDKWGGIG